MPNGDQEAIQRLELKLQQGRVFEQENLQKLVGSEIIFNLSAETVIGILVGAGENFLFLERIRLYKSCDLKGLLAEPEDYLANDEHTDLAFGIYNKRNIEELYAFPNRK